MKKCNYQQYLHDILDAIDDVQAFVGVLQYDQFLQDKKTINAVIRSIEVIGEATKYLPSGFRMRYSDIPWKKMAGMRDKLIHEYFGIDYEILWQVIKKELPTLKKQIHPLLNSEIFNDRK